VYLVTIDREFSDVTAPYLLSLHSMKLNQLVLELFSSAHVVSDLNFSLLKSALHCHPSSPQLQRLQFLSPQISTTLPPVVTAAPALTDFQNRLKTYLFSDYFPHNCFLHLILYTVFSSGLAVLHFRPF